MEAKGMTNERYKRNGTGTGMDWTGMEWNGLSATCVPVGRFVLRQKRTERDGCGGPAAVSDRRFAEMR